MLSHLFDMKELYPWQGDIWQRLQGLRARLPNALLLKGAEGIGKLDLALNFAQSILCEAPMPSGLACQNCPSCHWFAQESNPDFRLIQPAALSASDETPDKEEGKKASREISVDQIRAISSFVNLSAHSGGYRVVLIHPAEAMNSNSANALLKTLEEPTDKLLFILVTNKPQQLLPTILSRSLSFAVPMPTREESAAWLKQQDVTDPETLLAQTGFAPLSALLSDGEGAGTEERKLMLAAVKQSAKFDALALADQLQRAAPVQVIQFLQQWCYDLASCKMAGAIRYHPEQTDLIGSLSRNLSQQALLRYIKELQVAKREAFHPLNPKLLFESILLAYQQMLLTQNKA
jgi:DNA polymerase III subunit delta'